MIVNFDGIAIATITFQHYSTVVSFLECLESGLLPKGCLQPPLFFLRNHHKTQRKNKSDSNLTNGIITTRHPMSLKKSNSSLQLKTASPDPSITVPYSSVEVTTVSDDDSSHIWNQVFAVRCGSRPVAREPLTLHQSDAKKSSILMGEIPGRLHTRTG